MQALWLTHRLDLRLIDISGGAIEVVDGNVEPNVDTTFGVNH